MAQQQEWDWVPGMKRPVPRQASTQQQPPAPPDPNMLPFFFQKQFNEILLILGKEGLGLDALRAVLQWKDWGVKEIAIRGGAGSISWWAVRQKLTERLVARLGPLGLVEADLKTHPWTAVQAEAGRVKTNAEVIDAQLDSWIAKHKK